MTIYDIKKSNPEISKDEAMKIIKVYRATRRKTRLVPGMVYDNQGGGRYFCVDSWRNEFGKETARMVNVNSGWDMIACNTAIYEDGKIDWDYSTGGSFSEWLAENSVQTPKQTFTRVTSHHDGRTVTERIYACDQVEAIERFRRAYPEQHENILVAEDFHPEDPKNEDYIKAYAKAYL